MSWNSEKIGRIVYNKNDPFKEKNVTEGGVQALFSEDGRNLSSQLFLTTLHDFNGENFTCSAFGDLANASYTSVIACIIGETIVIVSTILVTIAD